MSNIGVIGFGAMNVDLIHQVDQTTIDGEQVILKSKSFPGGSSANTVYGLAKLGVNTGFVGAVGSDTEGQYLINDSKEAGVDISNVIVKKKCKTGSASSFTDKHGNRALYISPCANKRLTYNDIDISYLKRAEIVHISSFTTMKQLYMQRKVVEEIADSVKISFAPGMLYSSAGLGATRYVISKSTILFFNRDEIELLTRQNFKVGALSLLKLGCKIVAVTFGKGIVINDSIVVSYIRDDREEYIIEQPHLENLKVIDTLGAGDAFAAGFLYSILKGKSLQQAGLTGSLLAIFAIGEMGARKGLPSYTQLNRLYRDILKNNL